MGEIGVEADGFRLIDSTKTDEGDEIYITKLALSLGRCKLPWTFHRYG